MKLWWGPIQTIFLNIFYFTASQFHEFYESHFLADFFAIWPKHQATLPRPRSTPCRRGGLSWCACASFSPTKSPSVPTCFCPSPLPHSGPKWQKNRWKKSSIKVIFTSFSMQVFVNLHNFRFRLAALHIQNLWNRCIHKYDPTISRIFWIPFLRFFGIWPNCVPTL